MISNDLIPNHIVIMDDDSGLAFGQQKYELEKNISMEYGFNINESLEETLKKKNLAHDRLNTKNINEKEVIDYLKNRTEKVIITSVYGGQILKKEILSIEKDFLHIHSGRLPDYRGSTTVYYSILNEKKCFATALILNREIDGGKYIKVKEFSMPGDKRLIDHVYDPSIRADTLIDVLIDYKRENYFHLKNQSIDNAETYFIIHPVLKHISILAE